MRAAPAGADASFEGDARGAARFQRTMTTAHGHQRCQRGRRERGRAQRAAASIDAGLHARQEPFGPALVPVRASAAADSIRSFSLIASPP